eukprot:TRINITY_DN32511_c0_g1_i1.p2 TRINITY_DN32511_c0_g1~~TRINITY_DN32511_c0_g1_i1.p2  ORF type:complete len:370 (+),score=171.55 TRINITY_DN32511_c0_g1_i1:37-1146(+)
MSGVQQLMDMLAISETEASNLLAMANGDVGTAAALYFDKSPARPAAPASAGGGRALGSSSAPAPAPAPAPAAPAPAPEPAPSAPAAGAGPTLEEMYPVVPGKMIRIRVQSPGGQHDMEVDDGTPLALFYKNLEDLGVGIPANSITILFGFPPKPVSNDNVGATLSALGIKRGERITLRKSDAPTELRQGHTKGRYIPPTSKNGSFTRREMPGDNSCLFHSMNYVINNKKREDPAIMRRQIADIVLANPAKYTATFLEQHPASYAQWIQQKNNWGGAIELSILSHLHECEIIALDVQTKRQYRFGEDEGYSCMCFVLFSGQHYDAMAMAEYGGAPPANDLVVFNAKDPVVTKKALDFIAREHEKEMKKGR